jgi:hypothetical protein
MLEALGGLGLASAAGLNAYIPAIIVALLDRYTDVVTLPEEFAFLSKTWVLVALILLLVVEEVVDKIPGADHVNDIVQSFIRPASGAVLFAANASETFGGHVWLALIVGFVMALTVHSTKAATRGVANLSTGGVAAPVISVVEDVVAVALSAVAILFPILVLAFLVLLAFALYSVAQRFKERRIRREQAQSPL